MTNPDKASMANHARKICVPLSKHVVAEIESKVASLMEPGSTLQKSARFAAIAVTIQLLVAEALAGEPSLMMRDDVFDQLMPDRDTTRILAISIANNISMGD